MLHKKEELIREQRTIEATRKNLTGANGKLGSIAQYLGSPILKEGSSLFSSSYLDDPLDIADPDEIQTILSCLLVIFLTVCNIGFTWKFDI